MAPVKIASVSGKGGVGKSTATLGIARALQAREKRVGIIDLDLESSSLGGALGLTRDRLVLGEQIEPVDAGGIKAISLSMFLAADWADTPTLLPEEEIFQLVKQFFLSINWGDLDVLVIDHPPGSGPELRALIKQGVDALVLVAAAQRISEMPVRRLIRMAREELPVEILGIVANDPYNAGDLADTTTAQALADRYELPILTTIEWRPDIVAAMDGRGEMPIEPFLPVADAIIKRFEKRFVRPLAPMAPALVEEAKA